VEEGGIAPRGVLRRELDVIGVAAGVLDGSDRVAQHLLRTLAQLVLHVDVAGGDEDVDPGLRRTLQRLPRRVDVLGLAPGQPRDLAAADGFRDALDRLEVAGAGDGKPGLDDVHAELLELTRH
jgi:hypothetical protein